MKLDEIRTISGLCSLTKPATGRGENRLAPKIVTNLNWIWGFLATDSVSVGGRSEIQHFDWGFGHSELSSQLPVFFVLVCYAIFYPPSTAISLKNRYGVLEKVSHQSGESTPSADATHAHLHELATCIPRLVESSRCTNKVAFFSFGSRLLALTRKGSTAMLVQNP